MENTIGPITWEYDEKGSFLGVSDGLFTVGKTAIITGQNYGGSGSETTYSYPMNDGSSVAIKTLDNNGNGDNGILSDTFVEIRVYK